MSGVIDIKGTPGPIQKSEGGTSYRIDPVHYQGRHIDRRVHVARVGTTCSPEFDRHDDAVAWVRRTAASRRR